MKKRHRAQTFLWLLYNSRLVTFHMPAKENSILRGIYSPVHVSTTLCSIERYAPYGMKYKEKAGSTGKVAKKLSDGDVRQRLSIHLHFQLQRELVGISCFHCTFAICTYRHCIRPRLSLSYSSRPTLHTVASRRKHLLTRESLSPTGLSRLSPSRYAIALVQSSRIFLWSDPSEEYDRFLSSPYLNRLIPCDFKGVGALLIVLYSHLHILSTMNILMMEQFCFKGVIEDPLAPIFRVLITFFLQSSSYMTASRL